MLKILDGVILQGPQIEILTFPQKDVHGSKIYKQVISQIPERANNYFNKRLI